MHAYGGWQNDPLEDPLQDVRKWFDLLAETWRAAYHAGTTLTIDETMIFWTGLGVHLTYLPRKPTPLRIMLKTICNATSRISLGWEFCEGKEVDVDFDSLKQRYQDLGACSSCTLRLTLPCREGCCHATLRWSIIFPRYFIDICLIILRGLEPGV
jgi:hypothetical protein